MHFGSGHTLRIGRPYLFKQMPSYTNIDENDILNSTINKVKENLREYEEEIQKMREEEKDNERKRERVAQSKADTYAGKPFNTNPGV